MILIIHPLKRRARELSELLRIMGYLAYPILPREFGSEFSQAYRAAVIATDTGFADLEEFIGEIRSYSRSLPLFMIGEDTSSEGLFMRRFASTVSPAVLIKGIREELTVRSLPEIGVYRGSGFFASVDSPTVSFLGRSIKFTHAETMILRYLISSYPTPKSAKDILLHAFRPSKLPEPSSVRTHISCMNKKIRKSEGRPLIEFIADTGYRLSAPSERQFSYASGKQTSLN
jgi:DNA-binding winged helix-turn-helix (wHTH) protein